ncbi:hypothetical protein IFR05_013938 [Cadophora sp. M221]|nr:hypothetical protein IFR05_013938 [Cadophora sp. M221]
MTNRKSRLGNLFRFLSPGPPSPATQNEARSFQYESQTQLAQEYEEEQARQIPPVPSFTFIPAEQSRPSQSSRPQQSPAHPPQQAYNHRGRYYAQEPYTTQQTYSSSGTNSSYPPYVPSTNGHICRYCVAADRFPVRPTRCPFEGIPIGFPQSQQHPPIVTTSSTLQARNHLFERLEFVEVPTDTDNGGDGARDMRQREQEIREWTGESTMDDPAEYISDRRRRIIEAWMDVCIEEGCSGWDDLGELGVWGRGRWGDDGYFDEPDDESEGDAWRMLDSVNKDVINNELPNYEAESSLNRVERNISTETLVADTLAELQAGHDPKYKQGSISPGENADKRITDFSHEEHDETWTMSKIPGAPTPFNSPRLRISKGPTINMEEALKHLEI